MQHPSQVKESLRCLKLAVMASSKTTTLALILVIATLLPAASAWQESLRAVTHARMYISGVVAIATLPAGYVSQVRDHRVLLSMDIRNGSTPVLVTRNIGNDEDLNYSPVAILVQACCMPAFMLCIISLFASFVTVTMLDQVNGICLLDDRSFWRIRCVANVSFFAALFLAMSASAFIAMANPIPWLGQTTLTVGVTKIMALAFTWIGWPVL